MIGVYSRQLKLYIDIKTTECYYYLVSLIIETILKKYDLDKKKKTTNKYIYLFYFMIYIDKIKNI